MSRSPECLDRRTAQAVAAGRCSKKELAAVRRHLAGCARCRASVVAQAAGVRGPGDTVVLKHSGGPVRTAFKLGAVAVSLLAAGGAWRYGAGPKKGAEPVDEVRIQAPLEPAPPPLHGELPTRSDGVASPPTPTETAPTWRTLPAEPLASAPASPAPPTPLEPTVRVVRADTSTGERQLSPRRRAAARTAKARRASTRKPATDKGSADEASQADEDVDFGIEEPATRPNRKAHRRTTRD